MYIKSPLNYTGGKYKLLPQLLPLFPSDIDTFYDLFCGGMNVSINVNADKIVVNDSLYPVIKLLSFLKVTPTNRCIKEIHKIHEEFDLHTKEGYLLLRNHFNAHRLIGEPLLFYSLICCSFSNQIRFNRSGDFNMPYGSRYFNPTLEEVFEEFVDCLHKLNVAFHSKDFERFDPYLYSKKDFVYLDPPYLGSVSPYNTMWVESDEIRLLDYLGTLDTLGVRFALSNNLKYNNPILKPICNIYNVHYLDASYNNCNYHKKDRITKDCEVLITNY